MHVLKPISGQASRSVFPYLSLAKTSAFHLNAKWMSRKEPAWGPRCCCTCFEIGTSARIEDEQQQAGENVRRGALDTSHGGGERTAPQDCGRKIKARCAPTRGQGI